MKKLITILFALCSIHAYSQILTVAKTGNLIGFYRSNDITVFIGANEYFDCIRNSNDTTKIVITHNNMNGAIWSKASVTSINGVSTTGLGALDIARQIKDLVSGLNVSGAKSFSAIMPSPSNDITTNGVVLSLTGSTYLTIRNKGTTNISITYGANNKTQILSAGALYEYKTYANPVTNQLSQIPAHTINANGGIAEYTIFY
jgi:hypothetical protein